MNPTVLAIAGATWGVVLAAVIALLVRLNGRFRDVEKELIMLRTQVSPLWARVQAQISADLHHPHPRYHEMDGLLEKLEALTITKPERARLKELLIERSTDTHPDISDDQKRSALLMIPVMDMVQAENVASDVAESEANALLKQTVDIVTGATVVKLQAEELLDKVKDREK